MKIFLIFFFVLITIWSLKSQSVENTFPELATSKSIEFGAYILPQMGSLWNVGLGGKGKPAFSYSIGANIDIHISDRIKFETGLHLQQAELKQRSHNLRWPDDVINGQWDPTRSYEQFEAIYFSVGVDVGVNLALSKKENGWSLCSSVLLRRMLRVDDQLVINESGYIHEPIKDEFMNTYNKTQLFLRLGAQYQFRIGAHNLLRIGPGIEYSISDLISTPATNSLWTYDGGHPVFFGLKTGVIF